MFVHTGLFAEILHLIIYPFTMQADNLLISRLEKLARLKLESSEKARLANDMNLVLNMVDKLLELDTTGIEPLAYPTNTDNNYRNDELQSEGNQEVALKNAPDHNSEFFRVPKVIE